MEQVKEWRRWIKESEEKEDEYWRGSKDAVKYCLIGIESMMGKDEGKEE